MVEQKQDTAKKSRKLQAAREGVPLIAKIRPGTAAEKSLKIVLPEGLLERSVTDVVNYALKLREEDGLKREDLRIQERLDVEMKSQYGVTVNGEAIKGTEKIAEYLKDAKSAGGVKYKQVDIIIASKQQGALEYFVR